MSIVTTWTKRDLRRIEFISLTNRTLDLVLGRITEGIRTADPHTQSQPSVPPAFFLGKGRCPVDDDFDGNVDDDFDGVVDDDFDDFVDGDFDGVDDDFDGNVDGDFDGVDDDFDGNVDGDFDGVDDDFDGYVDDDFDDGGQAKQPVSKNTAGRSRADLFNLKFRKVELKLFAVLMIFLSLLPVVPSSNLLSIRYL